jgi:hypothetical protein
MTDDNSDFSFRYGGRSRDSYHVRRRNSLASQIGVDLTPTMPRTRSGPLTDGGVPAVLDRAEALVSLQSCIVVGSRSMCVQVQRRAHTEPAHVTLYLLGNVPVRYNGRKINKHKQIKLASFNFAPSLLVS